MKAFKFHLSIEHLWGLTALAGIFIFVNTHPIRPHDFWWHITIGREILNTRHIPIIDVYSYTASGQAYPSYQMFWLMDVVLYGIYKLGGPALVVFIHSILIAAAYGLIFWLCKEKSNSWRIAAFGVLFAGALGLNDWNVRPQGITFLLASIYLLAIYEYKKNQRWTWLLVFPLVMLVWANSHGTFVIGLVLIGIWLGQELWDLIISRLQHKPIHIDKRIFSPLIALVSTVVTCFLNPRGLGIIEYVRTLTGNTVVRNLVVEWAPPNINTFMGMIFFIGLVVSGLILVISPKKPNFSQWITFLIFGLLGLRTSRGIVWFGLVMAPIVAEHVSAFIQKYQKINHKVNETGSPKLNTIFSVVILAAVVVTLPWFKQSLPFPKAKAGLISVETPVKGTQILLNERPPGELFNAISFGSYLIWAAYPQYQVFVDSRIELFPEKVWLDYLTISNATGDWETLLKEYKVNTLMLSPYEQPMLIDAAQKSDEWESIYQDNSCIIFVRK